MGEIELFIDIDNEIKEIVKFDLLTNEERIKANELCKNGYLEAVKYIHNITGMGLKMAKTYYDLYIRPK